MASTSDETARGLIERFWQAMQANDWKAAAAVMSPDCVIDWPCSGERIVGPGNYAAIQERYPSATGAWRFDVHRIVVEGDTAVSEATVTDGEQSARVVAFATVVNDRIAAMTEYWPAYYEPPHDRDGLTVPGDRVP